MKLISFLLLTITLGGCSIFSISAEAALARFTFSGATSYTLGPDLAAGGSNPVNRIDSDFGLGEENESLYLRLHGNLGPMSFSSSLYNLKTSGTGSLTAAFGSISQGTAVDTRISLFNAKSAVYFGDLIPAATIFLKPGLGVNLIDLDINTTAPGGILKEKISAYAPLPVISLQTGFTPGPLEFVLEGTGVHLPNDLFTDFDGTFLDLEGSIRWHPTTYSTLFAGYRRTIFDGKGYSGSNVYSMDFAISGWFFGLGVKF